MKMRFPLYAQIISVLVVNLVVLIVIRLLITNAHMSTGWNGLLYNSLGDRLQAMAFSVHRQTESLSPANWQPVLDDFGKFYGVRLSVFDERGEQIGGQRIELPGEVLARMKNFHPPMPMRHPGPPPPGVPAFEVRGASPGGPPPGLHAFDVAVVPPGAHFNPVLPPPPPPRRDDVLGIFVPGRGPHGPPMHFVVHTGGRYWVGAFIPLRRDPPAAGILLADTDNIWQTRLISDLPNVLLVALSLLAISLLIWSPFVFGVTRALSRLTGATEKIAEGKFDTRIGIDRGDEIGRLAQAIDSMSARLSTYVSGQKRFLGDIAHELCSPVARLQIAIELLKQAQGAARDRAVEDIDEEMKEITSLINELLAFSKAGISGHETSLEPVELGKLIDSVVARAGQDLEIKVLMETSISCMGDELLIERALGNVLRNCSRYAAGSGPVTVKVARAGQHIIILVQDNGPGVPPEDLARLTEPFYRPEPSRSRESGGVGLGLAIVRACIEACGGSVRARNRPAGGFEVELKLHEVKGNPGESDN